MREAMRYGVARGLFSNESGLGSAPIVAAAAQTTNPVRQALVSSTGMFWDTVVMCALTGLVVVNSGEWTKGLNGAALTPRGVRRHAGVGPIVLTVGLAHVRLRDDPRLVVLRREGGRVPLRHRRRSRPYRVLWVIAVMVGSVVSLPAVWSFADIANALMAIPNLVSLLALTHVVVAETRRTSGTRPTTPRFCLDFFRRPTVWSPACDGATSSD